MAMTDSLARGGASATAIAHPNIALIKYWGKDDAALNTPAVESVSITLDTFSTRTQVAFDPAATCDTFELDGAPADAGETRRVVALLDLFRSLAGSDSRARVTSSNNFPTAAGLASSASGFAALAVAADAALALRLDRSALSVLARRGSGSAARSLFGGFVHMARARRDDGEDARATPLLSRERWPLRVVVALTSRERKRHLSTQGMNLTRDSSPFYDAWVRSSEADVDAARAAIETRDFAALAAVSEHSCLKMHGLMLSARPGLVYWNGVTVECLRRVVELRAAGHAVFFTIDAGPQVKAVCEPDAEAAVAEALADVPGVVETLTLGLGGDARVSP